MGRPGGPLLGRHVDVSGLLLQLHLFRDRVLHVHALFVLLPLYTQWLVY